MVVCQYFLQGRCRYGQNCRNEHPYNEGRVNRVDVNNQANIIWQIAEQITLAEKGNQWPLSCFAPIKDGQNLPGCEDYSPEEIRWLLYEAKANGNVNQAINRINELYRNAEKWRNSIKHATRETLTMINDIVQGKKVTSSQLGTSNPFGTQPQSNAFEKFHFNVPSGFNTFSNTSSQPESIGSIFGGGTTNQNIFSNHPSSENIFLHNPSQSQNIFSSGNTSGNISSSNTFSSSQNTNQMDMINFNQNIFSPSSTQLNRTVQGVGTNTSENIFSSANQSIFSNPNNLQSNVFSQDLKGSTNSNLFGGITSNSFQSQNSQLSQNNSSFSSQNSKHNIFTRLKESNPVNENVYSKVEDLNEEEKQYFNAPTYEFGKIPLKPPAQQYC